MYCRNKQELSIQRFYKGLVKYIIPLQVSSLFQSALSKTSAMLKKAPCHQKELQLHEVLFDTKVTWSKNGTLYHTPTSILVINDVLFQKYKKKCNEGPAFGYEMINLLELIQVVKHFGF